MTLIFTSTARASSQNKAFLWFFEIRQWHKTLDFHNSSPDHRLQTNSCLHMNKPNFSWILAFILKQKENQDFKERIKVKVKRLPITCCFFFFFFFCPATSWSNTAISNSMYTWEFNLGIGTSFKLWNTRYKDKKSAVALGHPLGYSRNFLKERCMNVHLHIYCKKIIIINKQKQKQNKKYNAWQKCPLQMNSNHQPRIHLKHRWMCREKSTFKLPLCLHGMKTSHFSIWTL